MARNNSSPGGDSESNEPFFAADTPSESVFEPHADPEQDSAQEDPRLGLIREFEARKKQRLQRRRRAIGIWAVVVATGLVIGVLTTVGRQTEQRPSRTSSLPAHVVHEDRDASGQSPESLLPREDRSPMAKGSNTEIEERRPPSSMARVSYPQPLALLTVIRLGDSKEKVFGTLATVFERRNDALVQIEGLRLRARGRSPHYGLIEVADVKVADTAAGSLRWFLFGDGRLLAWGRVEEWATAAERYELATEYRPGEQRAGS